MKKSKNLKKLLAAVLVFFTLSIFIAIPGLSADLVVRVTLLHSMMFMESLPLVEEPREATSVFVYKQLKLFTCHNPQDCRL